MRTPRRLTRKLCLLAYAMGGLPQGLYPASSAAAHNEQAAAGKAAAPGSPQQKPATAAALLIEGKRLLKARSYEAAAATLQQAADRAREQGLAAEDRAVIYYVQGLAWRGAGRDDRAVEALRQAVRLCGRYPEFRLDLAQVLMRNGQYLDARREAEHGLLQGLADVADQSDARSLLRAARTEYVRERFSAYLALSFGYDSNVLVGTSGPCSDAECTGSTVLSDSGINPGLVQFLRKYPTSQTALTGLWNTPAARQEWDLPATMQLELSARAFGNSTVNLWYEYRFYQYLLSSIAYDHDGYNFQEHSIPIYLLWKPTRWLLLHPQIEGFINFTGLRGFEVYQGGFRGMLEAAFSESARWTTRLLYFNQYRRSFDRRTAAYLDGDRNDLKALQELRIGTQRVRLRGQLSYRLRFELSGAFNTRVPPPGAPVPFILPADPASGAASMATQLGSVDYADPVGYLGNEVATRWRLQVPAGFEFTTGLSYEHRSYDTTSVVPLFTYPADAGALKPFSLPFQQRIDSQISFDIGARKNLRYGFAVELSYALLNNISTMANWLDNRNYIKHTAVTTFSYTF